MPGLTDRIDQSGFAALPRPRSAAGAPRRVGIEIEFGGITEQQAAAIAQQAFGGEIKTVKPHELRLEGSRIGRLDFYLDTAYRDPNGSALAELGLALSRAVVPVEVVTPPLSLDLLPQTELLREALREAGAEGSRDGLFLGVGLHLNIEIAGTGIDDILPTLRAYALIEDWLRYADPMDSVRRLLPFCDPYPRRFVDALAEGRDWTMHDLFTAYLHFNPTRNRGLDMLPLLAHLDAGRVTRALHGLGAVSPRPAYHYRLPDSRIDEGDWTIAYEWNRWIAVERLGASPDLLQRLAAHWLDHRASLFTVQADWRALVETFLADHGLVPTCAAR